MEDNNGENFSKPGIVVNTLPSGTGMLIMAHKDIEVFNNTIKNHRSMGIGINSWIFTGQPFESKEFDPFCSNINIHDNVITETNGPAIPTTDFGKLLFAICGDKSPDIIIDGIFNPAALDKNGKISLKELAYVIKPTTDTDVDDLRELIKKFDTNGDGEIDLKELVIGLGFEYN